MPIFSYLAIPRKGATEQLCRELAAVEGCQAIAARNQELVVLVTDTPDEAAERSLQGTLKTVPSLQSLSLAFGYDEKNK